MDLMDRGFWISLIFFESEVPISKEVKPSLKDMDNTQ